jgi:ABC-type protease/lipase transport system fused ATPase/permease subunit
MTGRSVIVVAHRLSTVRRADRIAVVDRAALVELGTHDELVARGGAGRGPIAALRRRRQAMSTGLRRAPVSGHHWFVLTDQRCPDA